MLDVGGVLIGNVAEIAGHEDEIIPQFEEQLAEALQGSAPGADVQIGQV
jgi:hypothetical protein